MNKLLSVFSAAAVLALAALSAPAQAQPHRHYDHGPARMMPPPPPRPHFRPPPPPPRAVYGPGYYGPRYHHPRHHAQGRGWRDNDRDGVPNRYDRRPNNPYRY